MTLDLPLEPSESRSNSNSEGSQKSEKQNVHYISTEKPPPPPPPLEQLSPNPSSNNQEAPGGIMPGDNYSYVQLTAVHEYNYPVVDEPNVGAVISTRRDSTCSLKKRTALEVILSCVINRDLQYFKVMPTFHHWRAGKQRNGLTFQTAADARAFDKGIIRAYDDLID
uniref:WH1 domain-containing protein n=1 Tax=Lutzomyia longipalpis TaxID=7200 RepID=A0A1B0CQU2_LUTLO